MTRKEIQEVRSNINRYFMFVKAQMATCGSMKDGGLQLRQSVAEFQNKHRLPQANKVAPVPLNPGNLEKHTLAEAENHMSSLATKGAAQGTTRGPSPDGIPITIAPGISRKDLKLPPTKKRKADGAADGVPPGKSPKLPTPKLEPSTIPQNAVPPPPAQVFKCEHPKCGKMHATKTDLTEHYKWHQRETEKRREEDDRQKAKVENPLEYALGAVSSFLGLARDGSVKNDATKQAAATPRIKTESSPFPGSTPHTRAGMTPGKTPAAAPKTPKPEPAPEQMPTPPSSIWDTPGPYSQVHQCLEGLQQVSILDSLDNSLFAPAYTPEDSDADSSVTAGGYEDWDAFEFKESAGSGLLVENEWDTCDVPVLGRSWAEDAGFMMFAD